MNEYTLAAFTDELEKIARSRNVTEQMRRILKIPFKEHGDITPHVQRAKWYASGTLSGKHTAKKVKELKQKVEATPDTEAGWAKAKELIGKAEGRIKDEQRWKRHAHAMAGAGPAKDLRAEWMPRTQPRW